MESLNLQTKIVLYTVGVIVTMVVVFTGMNLWLDFRATGEQVREHVADLARSIGPTVESDLQHRRLHELRRTVRSFAYNERIKAVGILGPDFRVLAGNDGEFRIPEAPGWEKLLEDGLRTWMEDGKVSSLAPVRGNMGDLLGYVHVSASTREENLVLRRKLARSMIFGGLFGIIGCIAGYFAGKRLTRPIEELTRAADELAQGRTPKTLKIHARDELGILSHAFNKMVRKRREAEASLERSRQHLLFLLRETPLGYIEWDLDFRVVSWNKAAERIFGYTEAEARGCDVIRRIVPDEIKPEIDAIREGILSGTGGTSSLNDNIRADGSRITCQWNNTVIRDATGRPSAVASLVNDVTESIRTQERMRQTMEAAQKATRAKSEFLANMSHEIRTPMNGVIGLTELLLESELDPQQRSYLEVIRSSGEMLLTIINDILDLSKIESGKLALSEQVFSLPDCLRSAFRLFTQNFKSKGLSSRIELDPDLPAEVSGDPVRLRQIVYNLVSNALKFTESGSIDMSARAAYLSSRRVRLTVTVSDTGSGIDSDRLQTIFEPFNQADASPTRTHGGTGLGLTICKRLCQMMRGDIRVEQTSPEGTRFTFHVELQATAPGALPLSQQLISDPFPAAAAPATALTVLIVEDNAVNRLVIKRILTRLGHQCHAVANGSEAIEFLKTRPCDLVFMDLQMPVMDGFTATRRIRETMGDSIAIIALTASAVEGDRERCLQAGMDDYLAKPVRIAAVSEVLDKLRHRLAGQA